MKKMFFILSIVGVGAVSCTKDYSCTCTTITTSGGQATTQIQKFDIQDASTKQAKLACNEATVIYTGTTWGGGTYTQETTCDLK